MEKSYFSLDICNEYYEGYHNPKIRWNGWAAPCFTKEIADKIMENISNDDCKITYNKDKDEYVVIFNNDDEQKEIYEMETIDTDEGKKQVYSIGSCSWTWYDYSLEDIKKDSNAIIVKLNNENDKEFPISMEY